MKKIILIFSLILIICNCANAQEKTFVNSNYSLNAFNVEKLEYEIAQKNPKMFFVKITYKNLATITFLITPREKRINETFDVYNFKRGVSYMCSNKFSSMLEYYMTKRYVENNGVFF
jgi:hypothetical protein